MKCGYVALLLGITLVSDGWAEGPAERGQAIAEELCARCHAIGREGDSPLASAPAFRELGERYPIANLEEALAEGIVTAHPDMPEFAFEPDDVTALIIYLESIQDI